MNKNFVINELGVYIETSDPKPISLKELIQAQFADGSIPATLTMSITIAPQRTVTLVDDLIQDINNQDIHHAITVIVHEQSSVLYKAQIDTRSDSKKPATIITKELTVSLRGEHAHVDVLCSWYGDTQKQFKLKTVQEHHQPKTTSNVTVKSVLDDGARLMFNGMIKIHKHAQQSNAQQTNKNIILGSAAKAVSAPQLEIEANDVVCKHGAAISTLKQDDMFYLQSRGLDSLKTRALLVDAFLQL